MKNWKTKDGKFIDLVDMETSHIENCIKLMEKKIKSGDTIRRYGGGSTAEDMWYDEEDMTKTYEEDIRDFKLEILWRERRNP